jgi:6-phosphogluconolactonase (cycloisomerase 2 family)
MTQVGNPNQPTPFGFAFTRRGHPGRRRLIVTEPFGATPVIPAVPFSAVSSFALNEDGELEVISSSVPNGQGTSCWIALDPDHRYAYIGNNATSNISSYRVAHDGTLTLRQGVAAARAGGLPNDLAVAQEGDNNFLYVLYSGTGTVGAYRINPNGTLTSLGEVGGLPVDAGAQGLAAY